MYEASDREMSVSRNPINLDVRNFTVSLKKTRKREIFRYHTERGQDPEESFRRNFLW